MYVLLENIIIEISFFKMKYPITTTPTELYRTIANSPFVSKSIIVICKIPLLCVKMFTFQRKRYCLRALYTSSNMVPKQERLRITF